MTNTLIVVIALVALTVDVVFYLNAGAGWENSLDAYLRALLVAGGGYRAGLAPAQAPAQATDST